MINVNSVSACLYNVTGAEQIITSAYNRQSNGLVEGQSRTIKYALVKVLDAYLKEWPHGIKGVLFMDRVDRHSSTNFFNLQQRSNFTDRH